MKESTIQKGHNMKFKTVCIVYVTMAGLNALFFLLLPHISLGILQRTTNEFGILTTQMSGACALGLVVMTWLSRNSTDPQLQKVISSGNFVVVACLVIIDLIAIRSGAFNWLGWAFVAGDLFMAIAFAWLIFKILTQTSTSAI
jgi:hypothetical protein